MSARGKLTNEEVALAFLVGMGMLLMIVSGLVGVMFGQIANEALYGMLFVIGLLAFLAGVVLWAVLVKPWEQFDNINEPKDTGHH